MARTPLLRTLQRLFAEHRAARALETDVRDVRDRVREARVVRPSRRAFVAGVGAGAIALALPTRAHAKQKYPSIAIVGGGIAGLTCALKLADRGVPSTVYEASARAGGRMFSNTKYFAQGQVSEWCGELIDTGHDLIQHLANRFSLPLDDLHAAEPAGSEDTLYFDGKYYLKSQADADFSVIFPALAADANNAGYPTTFNSFTPDGAALDAMSIYDWIESRVPGGHASPLGQLLDVAYNIEFGADTTDQSALNLVYLLAFQNDLSGNTLDYFGVSDERYHVRGGNQQIPQKIADHLLAADSDSIQYGHGLQRIKRTPAGRYELTFAKNCGTVVVKADIVVSAIPFAVLKNLDYAHAGFDALKDEAIQELGGGHNGKTQLQFDSRIWNKKGAWPGKSNGLSFSDAGYQNTWDVTRAQPGANGILVFYTGGGRTDQLASTTAFNTAPNGGVVADANAVLAQSKHVFPGLEKKWNGKVAESIPHKSEFFRLAYSYWKVGQYTSFSGYEGVRQNNVFFCGEHTSQSFQGYMEGGAETGKQSAFDIAADIGAPNDPAVDAL